MYRHICKHVNIHIHIHTYIHILDMYVVCPQTRTAFEGAFYVDLSNKHGGASVCCSTGQSGATSRSHCPYRTRHPPTPHITCNKEGGQQSQGTTEQVKAAVVATTTEALLIYHCYRMGAKTQIATLPLTTNTIFGGFPCKVL